LFFESVGIDYIIDMKTILTTLLICISWQFVPAQKTVMPTAPKADAAVKVDNYTVYRLIVFNKKGELLMLKNKAGWHTPALRSNESLSIREAMNNLAGSLGLTIGSPKLAAIYTYKFEGLPDHRQVSFRTHFTAKLKSGKLIQPSSRGETEAEYYWMPVKEALEKITFDSVKLETKQILKFPQKIWGGSFLIIWKDDVFVGSKVLEVPYSLSDSQ